MPGGRPKGLPRTGGRAKGTPNKVTADLREAILNAFTEVGGQKYLVLVAKTKPEIFCTLLGKILPSIVAGDANQPLVVELVQFGEGARSQ